MPFFFLERRTMDRVRNTECGRDMQEGSHRNGLCLNHEAVCTSLLLDKRHIFIFLQYLQQNM